MRPRFTVGEVLIVVAIILLAAFVDTRPLTTMAWRYEPAAICKLEALAAAEGRFEGVGPARDGVFSSGGYVFQLFVPGPAGEFVAVAGDRPRRREVRWACYAWPSFYRTTGMRAFYADASGAILACPNRTTRYGGLVRRPVPGTAAHARSASSFGSELATDGMAADGEAWCVIRPAVRTR